MADHAFVVGAQRCGTTFLYRQLDDHPEITMARPVRPEPKVFLADDVTGDPQAYDALAFPHDPPHAVRGEKATSYLESEGAMRRIIRTFPQARVVVSLRDPVQRALSNYRFSVEHGLETLDLDAALMADLEGRDRDYDHDAVSVSPYAYVRRGIYLPQLQRLATIVSPARIHVTILEHLVAGGEELAAVYRFLGVDDRHVPAGIGVVNPSQAEAVLSPATRKRLRSFFAAHNARLAAHLGRGLEVWT